MPAIANVNDLQNMNNDLAGDYWLSGNIAAAATSGWNGGAGFIPVGAFGTEFTGTFDGKGYVITDLFIDRDATDNVGLFGYIDGATITDAVLTGVDITGDDYVGGCIGYAQNSTITGSSTTGTVTGQKVASRYVGGFAGGLYNNTVTSCHSTATVDGGTTDDRMGGFVGADLGDNTYTSCYATGSVTGDGILGGFAGQIYGGSTYTSCYATGDVIGDGDYIGGFGGGYSTAGGTTFSQCYANGNVSSANGTWAVGGFIGDIDDTWTATDCYAMGDVTASNAQAVGGFVGFSDNGTITNCFSKGAVIGDTDVGGFCGDNDGTITDCFWDTQTSGQAASDGGTGQTTAEMKRRRTFTDAGWDFATIWSINGITNNGYPWHFAMPPEPIPDSPRDTVAVEDKITLETIRNVEMAAGGRFYVNAEGKAVYKSRHARNA